MTKRELGGKQKKQYEKAVDLMRSQEFARSYSLFEKMIDEDSLLIDAWINIGSILYEQDDWEGALEYYQKALDIDRTYLPKLNFTAGVICYKNQLYEDAMVHFENHLSMPDGRPDRKKISEDYLEKCRFMANVMRYPVPFDPKPMNGGINTSFSEYLPGMTASDVMVFTRNVNRQEDLYYSVKRDSVWSTPKPILSINTDENEAAHSISANGKWMVLTICNRRDCMGSCDLFISELRDTVWSKPVNMGPKINSKSWEAQPALSANGNKLYFASNRSGGEGDIDIWYSERSGDYNWSIPKNAGKLINTPGKDETPFLHADGKTLYFASDGHLGLGDTDLFFSRKDTLANWSKPKHMGYPINTDKREGTLSVGLDGKTAFFATDRFSDPKNPNLDIYQFTLNDDMSATPVTYFKTFFYDKGSGKSIGGTLTLVDLKTNETVGIVNIAPEEESMVCIPSGSQYALMARSDDYSIYSKHFNLPDIHTKYEPYHYPIGLDKIVIDGDAQANTEPIRLNNLFYETGSAKLKAKSLVELRYLKNYIEAQPQISVEIWGHTDTVGTEEDNQTLSTARAKAVFDYLIEQGIHEDRLSYKGFGATKPVASNDTEEGRQENRRTEFIIK